MRKTSAQSRLEKLREEIRLHEKAYYVENSPKITDREFDLLYHELLSLEKEFPELISPDSPSQRVGGEPVAGFSPFRHAIPMLSMDNTYSEQDLIDFEARNQRLLPGIKFSYTVELKIDGVSLSLIYQAGKLLVGATRGDGNTGDNVTANVRTIHDIPLKLKGKYPQQLEVRGEVYINKDDFAEINQVREEAGETVYANPRNLAAGSLKQLNPRVTARRRLRCWVYSSPDPGALECREHSKLLLDLSKFGFRVEPHFQKCSDMNDVIRVCRHWATQKEKLPYLVDGMVVKVDSVKLQQQLGATSKAPRWQIAYKFPAEQKKTRLNDISIQVGRLGRLTPVAELSPVHLAGSVVRRASLHNADEIARKDIRIGDTVVVEKAGEVIPYVVGPVKDLRDGKEKIFVMPDVCPSCFNPVSRAPGEVAYRCTNVSCPAQVRERLGHYASRRAMDIEGLGPKLINQLVSEGKVKSVADLYSLSFEDLESLDRMAAKSARNLLGALNESRDRPLYRLIFGLGIRHVGLAAARILARKFGSLDKVARASREELEAIDDIGPIMADSIREFFDNPSNRELIDRLHRAGITMTAAADRQIGQELKGKTFVLTGTLNSMTRDEAQNEIVIRGGKAASSVSSRTDYVVVGAKPGSKAAKAEQLGVRILDESGFRTLLGL